jgi:hypothetical protein
MTLPVSLVINLVAYENEGYRGRQLYAWEALIDALPDNVLLTAAAVTDADLAYAKTISTKTARLARDGFEISGRHLAFVRDVMDCALHQGRGLGDDYWLGYWNSDVVVGDRIFEIVREQDSRESIHIHRTQVDSLDSKKGKVYPKAVEGWFIRRSVWERMREVDPPYPDMFFSEPGWGHCSTIWAVHHQLDRYHLNEKGAALHLAHGATWKKGKNRRRGRGQPRYTSPGAQYNWGLYRKLVKATGIEI